MGRYRSPGPPKSVYITTEGYQQLETELTTIWSRRRDVVKALSAAAAEGDRSENAEYIYRKKELREIDRRIRYLQKRLPDFVVIDRPPDNPDRVFFGAWVTLENEDGKEIRYRIVGSDELNRNKDYISVDSPLAKGLLKHQVDDEINIETPSGTATYWVTDISYET